MLDKNKPDWTPDAKFYDEGWADMNRRLDRKKGRQMYWLLLFLPLFIGGAAWLWSSQGAMEPSAPIAATTTLKPEKELQQAMRATTPTKLNTAKLTDSLRFAEATQEVTQPMAIRKEKISAATSFIKSGSSNYDAAPNFAVDDATAIISTKQADNDRGLPDKPALVPETTAPAFPAPGLVTPLIKKNIPYLVYAKDLGLEVRPTINQNFATFDKEFRWVAMGGLSYYPDATGPGGFLQNTYEVRAGKWTIPLSLRLERSKRGVTVEPDLLSGILAYPNSGVPDSINLNKGNLYTPPGRGEELDMTTIELRVGMGRHLGAQKRLMVSGGAGLSYLLAGKGPIFSGRANADVTVLQERLSFYGSNNSVQLNSSFSTTDINLAVDRLDLTGWLQLDYNLGSRFRISGSWSHTATAIYADRTLSTDRNGYSIGLGYRY